MDIYSQYQEDGKFEGDEGLFYILAGEGGAARKEKNGNYYIITRVVAGVYDISAASMVKRILVATWPISCEEYAEQKEENGYLHRFAEGVIYKVKGRLQYNSFGDLTLLYVKEVLEENASGTKLDKKQEKYLAPIYLNDEVLGEMVLEKSSGLFEGKYHFEGKEIAIYIEVEWSSKATWKKPIAVAKDFVEHIVEKDKEAREYIIADKELYEAASEGLEEDCEISFSTPQEFAEALKGRLKYIFVNQNGSYTIGYDDGYVFGGHEIDVDVNSKGKMTCAEMR